jgi:hypothetical protein
MTMATLADARRVKDGVVNLLEHHDAVNGIGIARGEDGYVVKVNLSRFPGPDLTLPASIEGVPITWEVVGEVRKS